MYTKEKEPVLFALSVQEQIMVTRIASETGVTTRPYPKDLCEQYCSLLDHYANLLEDARRQLKNIPEQRAELELLLKRHRARVSFK